MLYEEIVLITGISGAGKSTVIRCLEDIGFFCVDNLPITFIPELLDKFLNVDKDIKKIGFGIDIREKDLISNFSNVLRYLNDKKYRFKIIFLEADDDVLVRRFTETRRKHPLSKKTDNLLSTNIFTEKNLLKDIRSRADKVINTSKLLQNELKEIIKLFFSESKNNNNSLIISLISFGFKYGIPLDVDMLFDSRFLPNPYYIEDMKNFTGNDERVKNFVLNNLDTKLFISKIEDIFNFLLPLFIKEGKSYLTIGVGCTGGKHRSVCITNKLKLYFEKKQLTVGIFHRDILK